eukprot:590785_1
MSDPTVLDMIGFYATCCVLLIYIYIFICNFASHFKFNRCTCPWIVRDENVSAIYPTLLAFHIFIAFIISLLVTYRTWNNSHYTTQSISCYTQFKIHSTSGSGVQPADVFHLFSACSIYVLLLLETYFSYGRYYDCIYYVMKEGGTPSQYRVFLPFVVYMIVLFLLFWFSITMVPIITLFISIFHVLINTYYNYYFYIGIKLSYQQILEMQSSGTTHDQMVQQIKQIRLIFRLSLVSAFVSALATCAFIACNSLFRVVPICLCCSSFCLFMVFNNNKVILKATVFCDCKTVRESLCVAPFAIVHRRRSTFASRNSRNTTTAFTKAKSDHKRDRKKNVESSSEPEPSASDGKDEKVSQLKKKTKKRVGFAADVLMDIIGSEEEIIPQKPPLGLKPSSSYNHLKVDNTTSDIRKTISEPAAIVTKNVKREDTVKRGDDDGDVSFTTLHTIREWMAPTSFSKISEHGQSGETAKNINAFLNGYGFTAHSPDALKMDDLPDLETRIPNIDVIMEMDEEDTDEKVTDEEVTI